MVNLYQYREHNGVTHECSLKELRRLVSQGQLSVSAELRELGEDETWGPWREARSHPSLRALFNRAMWDGWNEQDAILLSTSDEQNVLKKPQETIAQRTVNSNPKHNQDAANEERVSAPNTNQPAHLPKLPLEAVQQLEDLSESEDSAVLSVLPSALSEPSVFQKSPEPDRHPSQFWKPEVSLREQQHLWIKDQPVQRTSQINIVRLLILVLPPILILWAISGYVKQEATSTFSPPRQETASNTPDIVPVRSSEDRLDLELKSKLRAGVQPMSPKASIDNALMVECLSSGLDLLSTRSKITDWRGRTREQPKVVKIDVTLQSNGEMEFELAMFALIIGKYIEHYTIEVTDILVRIKQGSEIYEFDMDSLDALQLYNGEQTAMIFLSNFL